MKPLSTFSSRPICPSYPNQMKPNTIFHLFGIQSQSQLMEIVLSQSLLRWLVGRVAGLGFEKKTE